MNATFDTYGQIRCNRNQNCSCVLPVIVSKSESSIIYVANDRSQARAFLRNRPSTSSCLMVTSRASAGLESLLHGSRATLIRKYESASPLGSAVNTGTKPSPVLAFHVPPDTRQVASSQALASLGDSTLAAAAGADTDKRLAMTFQGLAHGRVLTCLFDSGASSSFISSKLSRKLGLQGRRSLYKSVATAANHEVVVEGVCHCQTSAGPGFI
jgi:hypothetical protein